MEHIECVDFCEILSIIYHDEFDFQKSFNKIVEMAHFQNCKRIYFGTSFCGQQFLHISNEVLSKFFSFCKQEQIKATMVIPTFSQKDLSKGRKKVKQLIEEHGDIIDEVTVNDYGMLSYVREISSIKLNLGRLFMKDYRDPRFKEYFELEWKPKVFTTYLSELIKRYQISLLEFDPTHSKINYEDCPSGVGIGIHVPYCYITFGRICEYASIPKNIDQKYRPNTPCQNECMENLVRYQLDDQREWYRVGRTIYFENEAVQIKGVSTCRFIFMPLNWVRKLMEKQAEQKGDEMNESISSF